MSQDEHKCVEIQMCSCYNQSINKDVRRDIYGYDYSSRIRNREAVSR